MSQTTSQQCPTPTLKFNSDSYHHYEHWFQEQIITIGLLGGLYGVLTILSMISGYALLKRRNGTIQPSAIVLVFTILTLFSSTTVYMVTCILYYQHDFLYFFARSGYLLWSNTMPVYFERLPDFSRTDYYPTLQACGGSATLTVNVTLGDAIVWWRVLAIWRKNHIVKVTCGAFLSATFVLGVVSIVNACQPSDAGWATYTDSSSTAVPGILFEDLPMGTAACVLSLCTNSVATLLVTYTAVRSRRRLKEYFVAKVGGSQMEKLFSLLVESGAVYSAIWAAVVAFQIVNSEAPPPWVMKPFSPIASRFLDVFSVIMSGALIPIIAIYPTVIIVLVAFNRSHMERGLTQHLESIPTPNIALTVNKMSTSLEEGRPGRKSEVPGPVTDEQLEPLRCDDDSESEDVSEEGNVEGVVPRHAPSV